MKGIASVAIIGAGLSGLSCAYALRAAGVNVRVFERSAHVGGRCTTRLWQGHLVDLGVQYFTAQSSDFKKELLTRLRQFRPIISPILDRDEQVVVHPVGPRFYILQGNNFLAHVLSFGIDIKFNTSVDTVNFLPSGQVECLGETYHAVVSSLPGPQSARLLGLSESPVDYEPCLTAFLEYSGTGLGNTRECFARFLPESKMPVQASYCENHKSGRVVGQKTVFVVQATPSFSREHANTPPEEYLPVLAQRNEELWKIPAGLLTASYGHRWMYARPLEDRRRKVTTPAGSFICGDSISESSVEQVWLDGRRAANDVLSYLNGLDY